MVVILTSIVLMVVGWWLDFQGFESFFFMDKGSAADPVKKLGFAGRKFSRRPSKR